MATETCLSSLQIDNVKLLRPKVQLLTLLKDAGADQDIFTMKEVMFYLGKYIMSKELYDKQQQHIVHCENNALGAIFGVTSYSVKEPRALFAMISKNVTAVKIPESQSSFRECSTLGEADRGPEETNPRSSTSTPQQRKRQWSSDPASVSVEEVSGEPQKRQKSDNSSSTFGDSLSCVLGDLCRERGSSESSVAHSILDITRSHSGRSDECEDLESDNFSVDFEVESLESDTYSEKDEDSIPGEDEDITRSHSGRSDECEDLESDNFSVDFEVESLESDTYSEKDEDSIPGEDEDITRSHSGRSDEGEDLESDNFSVDFEVESLESDTYSEKDEDSIPGEDEDITRSHSGRSDECEDLESDNFSVDFEVESLESDTYSEKDEDSIPGEDEDITRSHSGRSDEGEDLESDNFSVDFEVESLESDTYSEKDEDSIPGEDEDITRSHSGRSDEGEDLESDNSSVDFKVEYVESDTYSEKDEDSIPGEDEDYWKCAECEELNPPLPHQRKICWKVCPGGLLEISSASENPSHDTPEAKALCAECPTPGSLDVLDGKSSRSQSASCSSCQGLCLCYSQPSTSSIQEETPELERSPKSSLPASCLEPCIICQSRPKDGTFIHGSTGHLVACYICAKKLEKCNKPCPVCQEPIQSVILTYLN